MTTKKPFLVLSYNICFQAMCHDARGSAYDLGDSCSWLVKDQLTICAQNMANFMDGAPASAGYTNFDFVGLQEASKVRHLQAAAKNSLAKLQMIESRSHATNGGHDMKMASFYDGSKYSLVENLCSQFNSRTTDRPFHILILDEISTGDKILFINVHSPHGSAYNTKHKPYQYSSFEAISFDLSAAAKTMKHFDPTAHYKIIMTGDFNETGWDWPKSQLTQKSWKPLGHAKLSTDAKIANVVYSCNKSNGCWHKPDGDRGGDYIFSSENAAKIYVPKNYKYAPAGACKDIAQMKSIWQSDHLPVMAEIS